MHANQVNYYWVVPSAFFWDRVLTCPSWPWPCAPSALSTYRPVPLDWTWLLRSHIWQKRTSIPKDAEAMTRVLSSQIRGPQCTSLISYLSLIGTWNLGFTNFMILSSQRKMSRRSDFDPNPQPGMIRLGWYLSPSLNCKYALYHFILNTFHSLAQSVQPLCELGTIFDHNRPHLELKQCLMPFKAISAYPLKVAAKRGDSIRNRCDTRPKTDMGRVYLL